MSHMPYWLAKTPEMVAMDRWFSLADAGSEDALADRYRQAIGRVSATGDSVFRGGAQSLDANRLPGGAPAKVGAFGHLGQDWLNLFNKSSGGDYWPQVPTWMIVNLLRTGVSAAAKKALGVTSLTAGEAQTLFHYEAEIDPGDPRESVLPLATIWVCTSGPGSTGFDVDAVRGPSVVELVISTPAPYQQSHLWPLVKPQVDAFWNRIHGDLPLPDPPPDPLEFPSSD